MIKGIKVNKKIKLQPLLPKRYADELDELRDMHCQHLKLAPFAATILCDVSELLGIAKRKGLGYSAVMAVMRAAIEQVSAQEDLFR